MAFLSWLRRHQAAIAFPTLMSLASLASASASPRDSIKSAWAGTPGARVARDTICSMSPKLSGRPSIATKWQSALLTPVARAVVPTSTMTVRPHSRSTASLLLVPEW
jgi:hypothetical protein